MIHLRDQLVLITGCSSGIGRALAVEFVRTGHRVVATARDPHTLSDLAGDRALAVPLDVTDRASIQRAVDAAIAWGGDIDMLVNNAGIALIGPVAELDPEELEMQLATNLVGPVDLIRTVVPGMAARRTGRIVNIGSVSGVTATPFAGAYCASKAALHLLSDALRMELSPFGITVVEVQPGAIASSLGVHSLQWVGRFREPGSLYRGMADAIERRARLSQGHPTAAEEFARVVVSRVTRARPPARIRHGRGSWLLPAVGRLPLRIRDRLLSRRFGVTGEAKRRH